MPNMAHYPCNVCGTDFASKEQLATHMMQGHSKQAGHGSQNEAVHCPTCNIGFTTREELETHTRQKH